jgi:hypothetical protein
MIKVIAIIAMTICDIFFIGGAVLLCAYKYWSLWTIFWGLVIACSSTAGIMQVVKLKVVTTTVTNVNRY